MWTQRSEDFSDWNIEVETSYSGFDHLGFPFCIWRESADNRLTLSRPRYCCVTLKDAKLYFNFFNPSEDIRSTGTTAVSVIAAGLMAVATIAEGWMERQNARGLDYIHDTSPPPFMILVGAFLSAMFAGMLCGVLWYAVVTLYRWVNGRFKGDGRIDVMPLNLLEGFQVINAGDAGAEINGKRATIGHGLAAAFADGSQIILTGDAWDYKSVADMHRVMTTMFCTRRAEYAAMWDEIARNVSAQTGGDHSRPGLSKDGIPQKL
jgi:hypothetical protein